MEVLEKNLALAMSKNWWVVLIHGIVGILFGLMLFTMPLMSILVLVYMFAFMLIFDGGISAYIGVKLKDKTSEWWVVVFGGIIGIILGIISMLYPNITAVALLMMVAIWTIIAGITKILIAIKLRKEINGEIFIILSGVLSVLVGLFLIVRPLSGMVALAWVAGFFATFYGVLLVIASLKLKKYNQ
ncbi:HdeD family acid-resistance protein [Campylobacter corcagiensis]|uniref:DUF308 domain-containing protein n=1 Tax=Campylobacter corcagiensis TaxID=1448857 RepID=A0A7M1LH49_9BACT|nr:DUF308 domain-containing protein [Campylobacter corcagiensis]QKF65021.1 HdeD family acid-resistance protein [Campylobacter corcagiensis]QOQ86825.1 DUF308 domain-containing protein [Campylobacter corcagiensis]